MQPGGCVYPGIMGSSLWDPPGTAGIIPTAQMLCPRDNSVSSSPQTSPAAIVGDPITASLRAFACSPPLGDGCPARAATHASAGLVELQADGSSVTHFFDIVARDGLEGQKHSGGISDLL